jgi:hypothetical protein
MFKDEEKFWEEMNLNKWKKMEVEEEKMDKEEKIFEEQKIWKDQNVVDE